MRHLHRKWQRISWRLEECPYDDQRKPGDHR